MEWRDEGIIIGGRRFGETSLILEVMTRDHGRHPGLVKGGRSKRMSALVQPGNVVSVTWRARLEDHLGAYAVETSQMRGVELMQAAESLHGLNLLLGHLRLLAEREPHPALYEKARLLLDILDRPDQAGAWVVRFELALLAESGFGLDLESCAATGGREHLVYVSPKSARAVSREAGAPHKDRLLPLPAFVRGEGEEPASLAQIGEGFRITGYFLDRDVFSPRGLEMPAARETYIALLMRRLTDSPADAAAG